MVESRECEGEDSPHALICRG